MTKIFINKWSVFYEIFRQTSICLLLWWDNVSRTKQQKNLKYVLHFRVICCSFNLFSWHFGKSYNIYFIYFVGSFLVNVEIYWMDQNRFVVKANFCIFFSFFFFVWWKDEYRKKRQTHALNKQTRSRKETHIYTKWMRKMSRFLRQKSRIFLFSIKI